MSPVRVAGWAGVAVLIVLGIAPFGAPPAAGDDQGESKVRVAHAAESWWSVTDPALPDPVPDVCTLPIGCPAAPAEPPVAPGAAAYPAGTLHVQTTGAATTAIAFVVPDFTTVPAGATLTGAVMSLPLNDETTSGNAAPETADLVACLTTAEVPDDVYGGTTAPPTFDCETAQQPAEFDADEQAFTVDLAPFLTLWREGTAANGVALLPDPAPEAPSSWALSINSGDAATGTLASTTVDYRARPGTPEPTQAPTTPPPTVAPPPDVAPIDPVVPEPVAPEPPAVETPPTVAPAPEPAAATPLRTAPYSLLNSPWYTYRGVVFLPLAFFGALLLTGRSLTRPLTLAVARRQSWRSLGD